MLNRQNLYRSTDTDRQTDRLVDELIGSRKVEQNFYRTFVQIDKNVVSK